MTAARKGYVSLFCRLPKAIAKQLDELVAIEAKRTGRNPDRCKTAVIVQAITLSHQNAPTSR